MNELAGIIIVLIMVVALLCAIKFLRRVPRDIRENIHGHGFGDGE
jgi:hypothetical protein